MERNNIEDKKHWSQYVKDNEESLRLAVMAPCNGINF